MKYVGFEERFDPLKQVIELLERHGDDIEAAKEVVRRVGFDLNSIATVASGFELEDQVNPHLQAIAAVFSDFFSELTFKVNFPKEERRKDPYFSEAGHPIARRILSQIPRLIEGNQDISLAEAMGAIYFENEEAKSRNPIIRRFRNDDGTFRIVRLSDQVALSGGEEWAHSYLYAYLKEAGECLARFTETPEDSRRGVTSIIRWASSLEFDAQAIVATLRRWGVELEFDR